MEGDEKVQPSLVGQQVRFNKDTVGYMGTFVNYSEEAPVIRFRLSSFHSAIAKTSLPMSIRLLGPASTEEKEETCAIVVEELKSFQISGGSWWQERELISIILLDEKFYAVRSANVLPYER